MIETEAAESRVLDIETIRADFPILQQQINGAPLVYLDNAATTQKPQCVIDAISDYYLKDNANVHRAAHVLSGRATTAFENARRKVAAFINSPTPQQVIWTRGTTEAINLVAYSWASNTLRKGDRILIPTLEHHSNIVPWQMVAAATGAEIVPLQLTAGGDINWEAFESLLDDRVKLVAVNHVSNALGTINPVKKIVQRAHQSGAKVLVDGAQAMAHMSVDVQEIGCDFYVFSGHKMFGPTGIGVLWGRESLLQSMPPWQGGGEMIESVSFTGTTYNELPYKFEAGTPDIAGAIGLGAAIDYLNGLDRDALLAHETRLLNQCIEQGEAFGLQRIGAPMHCAGVYGFLMQGTHPSDVGMLLDQQGVAVRTGHHCAQPLMDAWQLPGTVRASFSIYNTEDDVERLFQALTTVKRFLL